MKKNKNAEEKVVPTAQPKPVIPMNDDFGYDIVKDEPAPTIHIEEPEDTVPVEYAIVKPVPGGLQPIIAPKGQVQLNPVVVPVAFVPYATQNQPLYQNEVASSASEKTAALPEVKDQPLDKTAPKTKDTAPKFVGESKEKKVSAKKLSVKNRIGAFILMVLNIAFIAFVVINHFADKIGIASDMMLLRGTPDVIGGWIKFSTDGIVAEIPLFLITAATVIALANFITTFVGLCTARGYKIWISGILMFVITIVSTLLSAFGIFGDSVKIALNPGEAGTAQWLLTFISALILIFGLIFMPKKSQKVEDDD